MTYWLTTSDYKSVIRSTTTDMVTDASDANKVAAEASALDEVSGYLAFDYDYGRILGHRVFDHVLANTYLEQDMVIDSAGVQYVALQDVPASTALSNAAYWLKDEQKQPQLHDATTAFLKGGTVLGPNGERYLVLANSTGDDLTDADIFWLKRNNLLVMIAVDIALYHLHARIHAKQMPVWRLERYEQAIAKLKAIRKLEMNPGLPVIGATAGTATGNILMTSNEKRNNAWFGATTSDEVATQ